jgi:hypothetical protein
MKKVNIERSFFSDQGENMKSLDRFFSIALLCLSMLIQLPVRGDFTGPVNIFSAPFAQLPIVGVDGQGNAVILATAIDVFPNLYEKGSQLIAGVPQNFQDFPALGINQSNHSVSVNAAGNAIVAWQEVNPITSTYYFRSAPLLSNIWGSASLISDPSQFNAQGFYPAGLNLDTSNNGLATFVSQKISDSSYAVQNNKFNGVTWAGSQDFYTSSNLVIGAAMDSSPSGKAFALWFDNIPATLIAGYYDGAAWGLSTISSDVLSTSIPYAAVSMNSANNALFVWINSAGQLVSESFISGAFGPQKLVHSPALGDEVTSAQIAYDQFGDGFALWIDFNPEVPQYRLLASRYEGGVWGVPVTLDFQTEGGRQILFPSLRVDGQGSATAVWQHRDSDEDSSVYFNQYTVLKALNGWNEMPTVLSSPGVNSVQPQHDVNNSGDITVVWSAGFIGNQTIQAVYSSIVRPLPPASFTGEQIKVGPFNRCDIVNVLHWTASPDPSVVSYFLFRDGVQIATIPASQGPNFTYENHNRDCREIYVYSLTAVNGNGVQSDPLFVTLP